MPNKLLDNVRLEKPNYSTFDLSHDLKLSAKMGKLIPIMCQETLPGDIWRVQSESMFRMMPMIAPIMHQLGITTHSFYIPNRILWPNWNDFISGGETEGAITPAFPTINMTAPYEHNVQPSELADYLGLPVGVEINDEVNALPFAAYQRLWYEFYRDQNLEQGDIIELVDGVQGPDNTPELLKLRDRSWEHDYFTSCLPFAQKGDPVLFPLDINDAPVKLDPLPGSIGPQKWVSGSGVEYNPAASPGGYFIEAAGSGGDGGKSHLINSSGVDQGRSWLDPNGTYVIDGDDIVTNTTINDLRTAMALQKWLEINARAGSRINETLLAHFGVRSSDSRLQRPEYLGGSHSTMAISEVLQTSSTDGTSPQANMAGHGISVAGGKDFKFRCEEHGFIITVLSIIPKTAYYQGMPRFMRKFDRLAYYWPSFAHLGEESVKNEEVYWNKADGENDETFGYLPRYSDYRFANSRVAGQMRTSLEFWHAGRKFSARPVLNREFVTANPTKRYFAVEDPDEDEIVAHIFHKVFAIRPIPLSGEPGGI